MKLRGHYNVASTCKTPPTNPSTNTPNASSFLTMAPKRQRASEPAHSSAATTQSSTTATQSAPPASAKVSLKTKDNLSPHQVALGIWQKYVKETSQRTKLIDVFMAFLVVVGVLQFVYCVIVGNYVCFLGNLHKTSQC
jgi:cobalamin biosynthesis Mg chelatase CobN